MNDFKWLEKTYELVAARKIEDALDVVFDNFDDLFIAGKFDEADKAIEQIDVNKLDSNLLSGVLAASCCARDKLTKYSMLTKKVRTRLTELFPNRVDAIMKGLE